MWSADVQKERQLLQLRFAGTVGVDEAAACSRRVQELLPDLETGFCLLTDLSELEEMSLACVPVIDEIMEAFNQNGIRKVVRVIPDPNRDIGFGIMSLFHYAPEVRAITCKTLAEARRHLPW